VQDTVECMRIRLLQICRRESVALSACTGAPCTDECHHVLRKLSYVETEESPLNLSGYADRTFVHVHWQERVLAKRNPPHLFAAIKKYKRLCISMPTSTVCHK
jgi:hypothetical protein